MNTPNTESGFDDPSLPGPPDQRPSVDPGPNHVIWKGKTGQIVPSTAEVWDESIDDWSESFYRGSPLTEVNMLTTLYRIPKPAVTEPLQSLPDSACEVLKKDNTVYSEVIEPLMAKVADLQEQIAYLRAKYIMHQDALCFYEEIVRKACLTPGDTKVFKALEADCGAKALNALTKRPRISQPADLNTRNPLQ